MTREQAKREIVSLDFYLLNHTDDYGEESHTAMMMAINALEELPKRRKEAKRWKAKAMQHKQRWIPVSERLPEDHDWYVIVVKEKSTGYQYIPRIASHNHDNCWSIIDTEDADKDWLDDLECVAWMPLPEPYKVEPQEKRCADCNHYGKLSLVCGRCDDCSMFEPQESEEGES